MRRVIARTIFVLVVCLGILSNPVPVTAMDIQNFGVYQDTNSSGELDPNDTFLGGFMNWYTFYSAASSYNYGDHYVPGPLPSDDNPYPDPLAGFTDLAGAPYGADEPGDQTLRWLPISDDDESDDDVLHIYMVWSHYDNAPEQALENKDGFSLGVLVNSFLRSRSDDSYGGGLDLDIAIRNDNTSFPQVTLSDDYIDEDGNITGRPPVPGILDPLAQEQEFYKIAPGGAPYNHYFEGRWEYTKSTTDGGVIGGIHHDEYAIDINLSDVVTSVSGDGLVIRMDLQGYDELEKIIIYDFGYAAGADQGNPVELEIPLGLDPDKTFFIASIPDVVPEPVTLLSLTIMAVAGVLVARKRHNRA